MNPELLEYKALQPLFRERLGDHKDFACCYKTIWCTHDFADRDRLLLLENQQQLAYAFKKLEAGIKISLGISLDTSSEGIVANYDLGFDLEPKPEVPAKHKVKFRHVIDEAQAKLEGM